MWGEGPRACKDVLRVSEELRPNEVDRTCDNTGTRTGARGDERDCLKYVCLSSDLAGLFLKC